MASIRSSCLGWHPFEATSSSSNAASPASPRGHVRRPMWRPVVSPGHGADLLNARLVLVDKRPTAGGVRCGTEMANNNSTKLVTFVGKGGAGKTIAALLASQVGVPLDFADNTQLPQVQQRYEQYYASRGLRTCLVLQSQDPTADILLGQKLSHMPLSLCDGALTALRLESTKMLLEPLAQVKKADAQLNFSQGALDEVVGEELSVLPGMDPYLALGVLERLTRFTGGLLKTFGRTEAQNYDVVIYDGASSEDNFRMFGLAEKARYYLRLARTVAEKTDAGRVALPSVLRLLESAFFQERSSDTQSRSTAEIWDEADRLLGSVTDTYSDANKFTCFLVMNSSNHLSIEAARRYWGCAMQAGVSVAGVLHPSAPVPDILKERFAPLSVCELPNISTDSPDWTAALNNLDTETRQLLDGKAQVSPQPVIFDKLARTVTLFLPGFHKSEVKLSQWRGGTELLVEVGDQRRIVVLPPDMRGKVAGAKFLQNILVVTIKGQ